MYSISQELASVVDADPDLQEESGIMHHVLTQLSRYQVCNSKRMRKVFFTVTPTMTSLCFLDYFSLFFSKS